MSYLQFLRLVLFEVELSGDLLILLHLEILIDILRVLGRLSEPKNVGTCFSDEPNHYIKMHIIDNTHVSRLLFEGRSRTIATLLLGDN